MVSTHSSEPLTDFDVYKKKICNKIKSVIDRRNETKKNKNDEYLTI